MTSQPLSSTETTMDSLGPKETAIIVRKLLKANFPAVKFSVTVPRYSMASSVEVKWTDGPTCGAVDALIGCFQAGHFDGMTDSYDYDTSLRLLVDGVQYRPGTRYVTTGRKISATLANRCIMQIAAFWGGVEVLPLAVDDHFGYTLQGPSGPMDCYTPVRADLDRCHDSWYSSIHRAAADRTAFARED